MDLLLEVEGLKVSFGGVTVLSDGGVQLHVGSMHAPCGGNGADLLVEGGYTII